METPNPTSPQATPALEARPGFNAPPPADFVAPASVFDQVPSGDEQAAAFVPADKLNADGTVPDGVVPEPVPQISAADLIAMQQQLLQLQKQLGALGIGPADVEGQRRTLADTRLHDLIEAGNHEGVELRIMGASGYVGADGSWRPL